MKMTKYLSLTVAALAMASGSTALAGGGPSSNYYSSIPITFQLIATSQAEGYDYSEMVNGYCLKDRTSRQRIDNASILKMLKDEGVMNVTTDWQIVLVAGHYEGPIGFFITKVGKQPIDISGYIQMLTGEGFYAGYTTGKQAYTYEGYTETYTETKTVNYLNQIYMQVGSGESSDTAYAIGAAKLSYVFSSSNYSSGDRAPDGPAPSPSESSYLINSFSMPSVTGILGEYYGSLISGRVSSPFDTVGSPFEYYYPN